jgi:hypothetical protein
MKPKAWGGKITTVKIGPQWTFITMGENQRLVVCGRGDFAQRTALSNR